MIFPYSRSKFDISAVVPSMWGTDQLVETYEVAISTDD